MTDPAVHLLLQIGAVVPVAATVLWIWVAEVNPTVLERKAEQRLMLVWAGLAVTGLLVFGFAGSWAIFRLFFGSGTAAALAVLPALGFLRFGSAMLGYERST